MASVRIVDYYASSDVTSESPKNDIFERSSRHISVDAVQDQGGTEGESLFYSQKWLSVLRQVYRFPLFTAIDESQNLRIHLALVDNIAGKKLVSLPFCDYTDIDNSRSADYRELVKALKIRFPETPIILKTIGNNSKASKDAVFGRVTRNALFHRIPVEAGTTSKDHQSSSFRRNVRKAGKTGMIVSVRRDKKALVDFYTMYHGLRLNKFGSIPQPFSFFESIFEQFIAKNEGFLLEASHQGAPIASIIVLQHRSVLYYKFGASVEEALDLRPNNMLFDQLITYGLENNFEGIDLGLSGTGDSYKGLVRFKESMGGRPTPITYYQMDNQAKNTEQNAAVKKWLGDLTHQIVSVRPNPTETSILSETIYPLFA